MALRYWVRMTKLLGCHHHPFRQKVGPLILILELWSFVILVKCVGEVQRFSAWAALGSLILIVILAIAVIAPIMLLVLLILLLR